MKTIYFFIITFILFSSCHKKQNETNEAYKEYEFKIFPNPVQDVLNIQIKNDYSNAVFPWEVTILNSNNISIYSETYLSQTNLIINVSKFKSGHYFLILKKGPFTYQQKIIKQKKTAFEKSKAVAKKKISLFFKFQNAKDNANLKK